jgi:hypothetical protein
MQLHPTMESVKDDGPLTLYYIWVQSNIAMWQA